MYLKYSDISVFEHFIFSKTNMQESHVFLMRLDYEVKETVQDRRFLVTHYEKNNTIIGTFYTQHNNGTPLDKSLKVN